MDELSEPAHALTVRSLTLEEFRSRRGEYESLLAKSSADPLFHSFDWLELWWLHLGRPEMGESLVVIAAERNARLVGALPVIQNVKIRRGLIRYGSSAILGNVRGSPRGIPTEYTAIAAEPGSESAALTAALAYWQRHCSDRELTIGWTRDSDLWVRSLEAVRIRPWEAIRVTDPIVSYGVDLSAGVGSYAAGLSGNARRSMFNVRRRLAESASLTFRSISPAKALDALERMNVLHASRWNNPAFTGRRLTFHQRLIDRWSPTGRVVFSELSAHGKPISILYDIRWGDRQYNIQMGFDADALRIASPGVLHLGFAIEAAASAGVRYYDFLAGHGKLSDYKRRYANTRTELGTVQYLRGPALNVAARVALRLRRKASTVKGSQDD